MRKKGWANKRKERGMENEERGSGIRGGTEGEGQRKARQVAEGKWDSRQFQDRKTLKTRCAQTVKVFPPRQHLPWLLGCNGFLLPPAFRVDEWWRKRRLYVQAKRNERFARCSAQRVAGWRAWSVAEYVLFGWYYVDLELVNGGEREDAWL